MLKVFVVANVAKPQVNPAVEQLVPWLRERAELVGVDTTKDYDISHLDVDLIVAIGGDGTLLSIARRLQGRQIPVMGFNFGRLGFLALFQPGDLHSAIELALDGKLPVTQRLMIDVSVVDKDVVCDVLDCDRIRKCRKWGAIGLNDAVVQAGSPFRMIELQVGTDRDVGVRYFGDGMIVSTASGSTAYNISAGGPILSPNVEAMCLTPLCAHSLSFRPIVLSSKQTIILQAQRVNRGSEIVVDGQSSCNLNNGDRVIIRRADQPLMLVDNPHAREWQALGEKLNWASIPNYNWK